MQPTTSTVEVTSAASMEHEVRNELNTSSPMTLPDLISKLETAEGGSRELDCRLRAMFPRAPIPEGNTIDAERSGRHWTCIERDATGGLVCFHQVSELTTSVDAALTFIGERLPGWFAGLQQNRGWDWPGSDFKQWSACLAAEEGPEVEVNAPSPALALVLALLRALQSQDTPNEG